MCLSYKCLQQKMPDLDFSYQKVYIDVNVQYARLLFHDLRYFRRKTARSGTTASQSLRQNS